MTSGILILLALYLLATLLVIGLVVVGYGVVTYNRFVRLLTHVVPARHFNAGLQTVFLVGDVWPLILPALAALLAIGSFFFLLALRKTRKNLEG